MEFITRFLCTQFSAVNWKFKPSRFDKSGNVADIQRELKLIAWEKFKILSVFDGKIKQTAE